MARQTNSWRRCQAKKRFKQLDQGTTNPGEAKFEQLEQCGIFSDTI